MKESQKEEEEENNSNKQSEGVLEQSFVEQPQFKIKKTWTRQERESKREGLAGSRNSNSNFYLSFADSIVKIHPNKS